MTERRGRQDGAALADRRGEDIELTVNAELGENDALVPGPSVIIDPPCLLRICLELCCTYLPGMNKCCHAFIFLILSVIVGLHCVDLALIFVDYLGMKNDTVFFISYLTYLPHLTIPILFCLVTRIYLTYDPSKDRLAVFSEEYMRARSAWGFGARLPCRFAGLMVLPTVCICMKLVVFVKQFGSTNCPRDAVADIRVIGGVAGYVFYGCFCFVINCLFASHYEEFYRVAVQISKRGNNEIEASKADIRRLHLGFRSCQDFVGMWLLATMSFATLGLVFLIPYTAVTLPEIRKHLQSEAPSLVLWTIFVTADRVLFFVQPMLVVRGLDVSRPWVYFRECILQMWDGDEQLQVYDSAGRPDPNADRKDSQTLAEIFAHVKLLAIGGSWIKPTLVFSLVSLYLGIKLDPSQDLDPWIGLACRLSNFTDIVPL